MTFLLTFGSPADATGRRRFTLAWLDPDGIDRPEAGRDGKRVGHARGQCFNANPDAVIARLRERGHTVELASP